MLVLKRSEHQSIIVGESIVTVLKMLGSAVRIGISAPDTTKILRAEIVDNGDSLLMPEDLQRRTVIGRLRKMDPVERANVIRYIVEEFCGPACESKSA